MIPKIQVSSENQTVGSLILISVTVNVIIVSLFDNS